MARALVPPALRDARGQAAVELVVLLPLLVVLIAAVWQIALVGYAHWGVRAAARAAARAHAVGADPARAARAHLSGALEPGLRVSAAGGDVRVAVRVPRLPGIPSLGRVHATAHFEPQS
jgi:Flp pilus assembly protein TadG